MCVQICLDVVPVFQSPVWELLLLVCTSLEPQTNFPALPAQQKDGSLLMKLKKPSLVIMKVKS